MAARAKKATTKRVTKRRVVKPDATLEVEEKPKKVFVRRTFTTGQKAIFLVFVMALVFVLYSVKDFFIAATVNGYPLSRFAIVSELEKQGGQQVLDNLVNEMLIVQEARKANVNVSDTDVNAKVEEVRAQVEGQGQNLDELLSARAMSMDDLKKQLTTQIYIEQLLSDKIATTDEEITAFLETNKDYLPEGLSEDEYKNLAREELKQQKLSTEFATWIEGVKASANINYFVEY